MRTILLTFSLILVCGVTAFSQIDIQTNFEPAIAAPIDNRTVIPTLADTANVTFKYEGLVAYVLDVKQRWEYNGSAWVQFQTGGGGGTDDWNNLTNVPAGFADDTDDVSVETWATLSGIPAGFSDNVDNEGTDDQTAAEVSVSAITNLTATDVQGALAEHQADIDALAGGGSDGVATAGSYDAVNDEIDVTVAAPGSNFSIDVSALAEDGDIPTAVSQLTNDSGYLTSAVSSVVAGTGISVNNADPANPVVTNSSPDQTVSIASGTGINVTGSYPNFTVAATGGGGATFSKDVAQTGHGLSLYDPVYYDVNTGAWEIATNAAGDSLSWGMVVEVVDANNFKLQSIGFATLTAHPFTVGESYYLGSGFYQTEQTLLEGDIARWCFSVVDANTIDLKFSSVAYEVDRSSVPLPDSSPSDENFVYWNDAGSPQFLDIYAAAGLPNTFQFYQGNNPGTIVAENGKTYIIRVDNTNYGSFPEIILDVSNIRVDAFFRVKVMGANTVPVRLNPNVNCYFDDFTQLDTIGVTSAEAHLTFLKINTTGLVAIGKANDGGGGGGSGDNLGDHTMTTNLNVNGQYISGAGNANGIRVASNENVVVGTGAANEKFNVVGSMLSTALAGTGDRIVRADANGKLVNVDEFTSIQIQGYDATATVAVADTPGWANVPDELVGAEVVEIQYAFKTAHSGGTIDVQMTDTFVGWGGVTMADGDRVATVDLSGAPHTLASEEILQPLVASTTATTDPQGMVITLKIKL